MTFYQRLLSSALVVLCAVLGVALAQQQPLVVSPAGHGAVKPAISPELRSFIEELRKNGTIPGVSIAIIRPDGEVELEGFGKNTEDGDKLVPEVGFVFYNSLMAVIDPERL